MARIAYCLKCGEYYIEDKYKEWEKNHPHDSVITGYFIGGERRASD